MRIVGGAHRGVPIAAPAGEATRPTSDRVRESLFNILVHREGPALDGARVLDLFAGSGALGLEALSRGAAHALFVDTSGAARASIRKNLDALGATGRARVWRRSATDLGPAPVPPFQLIFLDPPYGRSLGIEALVEVATGGWASHDALAILEEAAGAQPENVQGWTQEDTRRFGQTALTFWRLANRSP